MIIRKAIQHLILVYIFHFFYLEYLQVVFALIWFPVTVKTDTRELVSFLVWACRKQFDKLSLKPNVCVQT